MKKVQDHYFHQAKKEGYVARSVYKLKEIDQKHQLLKKGMAVLDLGCSPGSWMQYCCQRVGAQGRVVGVDLKPVEVALPAQATTVQADIHDWSLEAAGGQPFDAILSDMAPKTTGIRNTDAWGSYELCQMALSLCANLLKAEGTLLVKAFQGEPFEKLRREFNPHFAKVKIIKPKGSRDESVEIFLLGLGWKGPIEPDTDDGN